MRESGYISPNKAASILKIDRRTVRSWCQKTIAGEDSPLKDVKQHINGYYWINKAEVIALRDQYAFMS